MTGARVVGLGVLVALLVMTIIFSPASASESPAPTGRWTSPFWEGGAEDYDPPSLEKSKRYPTAAAAIALPDGRLLYWNALDGVENSDLFIGSDDFTIAVDNARARVLDLSSDQPRWVVPEAERGTTDEARDAETGPTKDLFCSDHKLLYDGSVLIAGGSRWDVPEDTRFPEPRGVRSTRIFDASTDRFREVEEMQEPRWYPSLATLADGRVVVASGSRRTFGTMMDPEPSFSQVRLTEIYDPIQQRWSTGGTSEWSFPLYARFHLLPDGKLFYGGAGQSWNPTGETLDEAMWGIKRIYDPRAKEWTTAGPTRYGMRSGAASVMLKLEPPYDKADILVAGGSLAPTPGTFAATTLSEVIRWTEDGIADVGDVKPPLAGLTGDSSQLRNARWMSTPVLLPTGEVLLVNGGDSDDVLVPGSAAAIRTPELYDPEAGTWTELAPSARDRIYHSTAVLLPDGRVLVGGHAPFPAYNFRYGILPTRANNLRDSTFEIYEPPYLFRGDRPVIQEVVPIASGSRVRVVLGRETSARDISEVVLVRMGSTTHAMDADMRAVELSYSKAGSTLEAALPRGGDGRILPPGPYYLFAIRETAEGPVPSIGQTVLIQPNGGDEVVARSPR